MIFDTHSHYDDEQFDGDREAVLEELKKNCRIVNIGASLRSSERSVKLADTHDFMYAAVGVHPDDIGDLFGLTREDAEKLKETGNMEKAEGTADSFLSVPDISEGINRLRRLAQHKKVVAIGEIGLDYHWAVWPREYQRRAFIAQWELAAELNLPVEIHSRDAAEDTLIIVREMCRKYPDVKVDMHCYSYSGEHATEYLKLGLMFGIGGVATFKNAKKLKEIIEWLPMDRILLETDCPYLAPEPFRGQRNTSALLSYVAEKIAEIKGMEVEEVYRQTELNAESFFGL